MQTHPLSVLYVGLLVKGIKGCSHFHEIECDGKKGKVHHDFVFAKVSEADL